MVDYKFCSIQDVVSLTRIAANYSNFHPLIEQCISIATKQIQTYCRRSFVKQVYTEYFPTMEKKDGPSKIYLGEINVSASPSPAIRLSYDYPSDWSAVTPLLSQYYRIDYTNGVVTLLVALQEHGEAIQVVYTGGYDADTNVTNLILVPDDVRMACALQASYLTDKVVNQDLGQVAKNATGIVKMLILDKAAVHGIIPQARNIIGSYRKHFAY